MAAPTWMNPTLHRPTTTGAPRVRMEASGRDKVTTPSPYTPTTKDHEARS